jgi:sRNA-binding regulator protein Hfq
MPFYCPVCNHKSFTEKDEKEHVKTHQMPGQAITEVKKPEKRKKESIIPQFLPRFLHKTVSISLIDGSKISGKLTGFNNYDLMLDDKIMIPKHAMLTMQEVETKP